MKIGANGGAGVTTVDHLGEQELLRSHELQVWIQSGAVVRLSVFPSPFLPDPFLFGSERRCGASLWFSQGRGFFSESGTTHN